MSGRIVNPQWGNKADTFQFTLEDERSSLDKWLPQNVITKDWFPNAPDISLGMPVTVLFGHTATVCPLVMDDSTYKHYLIAGHHLWKPKSGGTSGWFTSIDTYTGIFIDGYTNPAHTPAASGGHAAGFEIINGLVSDFNSDGHYPFPISYLRYNKITGEYGDIDNNSVITGLFAGMPIGLTDKPSVPAGLPRDAMTLLYRLYTEYTQYNKDNIDFDSFVGAYEDGMCHWIMNSAFNGFGSDRMKTIDTIHKRLLPQMPVFEFYNQGKLSVKFINIWGDNKLSTVRFTPNTKANLIYNFNVLDRNGKVEEGNLDEVKNNFVIKYNPDIHQQGGPYTKILQYINGTGTQPYKDANYPTEVIVNVACMNSAAKFGNRPAEIIYAQDLPHQFLSGEPRGRTPAHALGEWLCYFYTFRPKYLNIVADHSTAFLNPGDFVTYTEENIDFNKKICLICSKNVESYKITYRLRTWENMASSSS